MANGKLVYGLGKAQFASTVVCVIMEDVMKRYLIGVALLGLAACEAGPSDAQMSAAEAPMSCADLDQQIARVAERRFDAQIAGAAPAGDGLVVAPAISEADAEIQRLERQQAAQGCS